MNWLSWKRRRDVSELDCAAAYAAWAPTYPPVAHDSLMAMEEEAVLSLLPDPAGRSVVDLACGSGRYMKILIARGARSVVGIDLSDAMLASARTIGPAVVRADLGALPLRSSTFDLAVCGLAVGHVPDLGHALTQVADVLGPGGVIVYSDMHPAGATAGWKRTFRAQDGRTYAVRHHIHGYEDHERACARSGLHIEEMRAPRIQPGHEWAGWPGVLVIRARKFGTSEHRNIRRISD